MLHMGRQHTIYLSDKTYQEMESLRKQGESMSQVIRTAVNIAFMNIDNYDLVAHQQMKIAALRKQIDTIKAAINEHGIPRDMFTELYNVGVLD